MTVLGTKTWIDKLPNLRYGITVLLLLGDDGSFLHFKDAEAFSLLALVYSGFLYLSLSLHGLTHSAHMHLHTHTHTRPKIHTLAHVHVCVCVNYPAAVTQRLMISHHCEVGLKFESLD